MEQLTLLMKSEGDIVISSSESRTVKTLADIVADRDKSVRNAGEISTANCDYTSPNIALNALCAVHDLIGDKIMGYLAHMGTKEQEYKFPFSSQP